MNKQLIKMNGPLLITAFVVAAILFFGCIKGQGILEPQPLRLSDVITGVKAGNSTGQFIDQPFPQPGGAPAPIVRGSAQAVQGGSLLLQIQPATTAAFLLVSVDKIIESYNNVRFGDTTGITQGYYRIDLADSQQNRLYKTTAHSGISHIKYSMVPAKRALASNASSSLSSPLYTIIITTSGTATISSYNLIVATESNGAVSEPASRAVSYNPNARSSEQLQVSLNWIDPVDMDLHVQTPSGEDIYYANRTASDGGMLDLDANAGCDIDNIDNENITWTNNTPRPGHYIVRADLWSACDGAGPFPFVVTVNLMGTVSTYNGTFSSAEQTEGSAYSGRIIKEFDLCDDNLDPPHVCLIPHRPTIEFFDNSRIVPEDQKENPGVGILYSGDRKPENLIKVDIGIEGAICEYSQEIAIKRSSTALEIWNDALMIRQLVFNNNELILPATYQNRSIWVEKCGSGDAYLEINARNKQTGAVISRDRIKFYQFRSIVITLCGEGTSAPDPRQGVYWLADSLYKDGYYVRKMNEQDVDFNTGKGVVLDEIQHSIDVHNITNIVLIGYSHGGGSVYNVTKPLSSQTLCDGTAIKIPFTAYIDAVGQPFLDPLPELRRPIGSQYHVNYYHLNLDPLDLSFTGGTVEGADFEVNVNETPWGKDLNHSTIHTEPRVLQTIEYLMTHTRQVVK